ncbi:hypothetical protein V1520DRAFT_344483 [Lipomyces starkeyi]
MPVIICFIAGLRIAGVRAFNRRLYAGIFGALVATPNRVYFPLLCVRQSLNLSTVDINPQNNLQAQFYPVKT